MLNRVLPSLFQKGTGNLGEDRKGGWRPGGWWYKQRREVREGDTPVTLVTEWEDLFLIFLTLLIHKYPTSTLPLTMGWATRSLLSEAWSQDRRKSTLVWPSQLKSGWCAPFRMGFAECHRDWEPSMLLGSQAGFRTQLCMSELRKSSVSEVDLGFFSCKMELVTPRAVRGLWGGSGKGIQ